MGTKEPTQNSKGRLDRIIGVILLLVGISIIWQSSHLRLGGFRLPGPGLFPILMGSIIVLLSLGLLVFPGKVDRNVSSISRRSLQQVGSVYAALIIFFAILEFAGFMISTFLLLFYLFCISGKQKVIKVMIRALIATGLSYLLFDVVLKSGLPKGLLGL